METRTSALFLAIGCLLLAHCAPNGETPDELDQELTKVGGPTGGDDPITPSASCYVDADGDGYGTGAVRKIAGGCPAGYTTRAGDCDDHNKAVTLGTACYNDNDGDGAGGGFYAYSCGACPAGKPPSSTDCNDADANDHPRTCFVDQDGDGSAGQAQVRVCATSCAAVGYYDTATDCNDGDKSAHALQQCDVDADGDAFAAQQTICAGSCPHVISDGQDCNDANASIHPMQTEVSNGVDDNCDGLVDETIFDYVQDGSFQTASSLHLSFTILNPAVVAYARAQSGLLGAQVTYRKLTNTTAPATVIIPFYPTVSATTVKGAIELGGLEASTIYVVSIELLDRSFANVFPVSGSDKFWQETHSEDYYTMTLANGGDTVTQLRPRIILKTLYNRFEFERGWVTNGDMYCGSYSCDVDHGGDEWCSEYFDSMIDQWLKDVSVKPGFHLAVGDVVAYFQSYGSYGNIDVPYLIANFAKPGDYIAMGSNNSVTHSSMFLAYDQGAQAYWHIDGNAGARVRIGEDWQPTSYYGVGYLVPGMLR